MAKSGKRQHEGAAFSSLGKRIALVVGANQSEKSAYRSPLKYAENDAYEMAYLLQSSACSFELLQPALLGRDATTRAVQEEIIELMQDRTDQDFLLFYFSGHAQPLTVRGDRQDIYLVTHDFNEQQIEMVPSIHISLRWLRETLYQSPCAGSILIILDCCYAGALFHAVSDPYRIDLRQLLNDFFEGEEHQNHQNQLRVILSATGQTNMAYEKDEHGFMTGLLLQALRGEVDEVFDDESCIDLYLLSKYLQRSMREQPPSVSGQFLRPCVLARYSPGTKSTERKSGQDHMIITESDFFERLFSTTSDSHVQPFDHALCLNASLDDLDIEAVESFFRQPRVRLQREYHPESSSQQLLEQFGFMRNGSPTYAALLCFGKRPTQQVAGAFTRCIYWDGIDRSQGWIEDRTHDGGLLEQFKSSSDFIQNNLRLSRLIDTTTSIEEWEIPLVAVREALANALVHREYENQTRFVQVELFTNRLEIRSPGGVPEPLTLQELGKENTCHPRNPQITRIFYLANHVEEVGSGIPRMRQAMKRMRLPLPSFEVSRSQTFSVILRRPMPRQQVIARRRMFLAGAGVSLLLISLLLVLAIPRFWPSSTTSTPIGIGITTAPDGEHIGISDGTYALDTNRVDGNIKLQASDAFKKGNISRAASLWRQAIALDTNDAEALIYLENQHVLASGRPYITLVVGTMLTGDASIISVGRDNLQGAYIAQIEYNNGFKLNGGVQVRLLIANSGNQTVYASTVAKQIVQAAKQDRTVVGVMGWPFSSRAVGVVQVLSPAHIPMVSPTASSDILTDISPYFFRVTPSNKSEAIVGAHYAEGQLHAKRAVIFVDPSDSYSSVLANAFSQQFIADGNQVVAEEQYTIANPQTLSTPLQNALAATPDLIYFAGYATDVTGVISALPAAQPNLRIMGGDALYNLSGFPASARADLGRLYFTAFAYPDEWNFLGIKQPAFFSQYSTTFDPNRSHAGSPYGYTRPDNDTLFSYDAMLALLEGCKNALVKSSPSLTPDALRQSLRRITGSQAIQGITGQISFGPDGDPINKTIVVLHVDSNGLIKPSATKGIQGCFLVNQCTNP